MAMKLFAQLSKVDEAKRLVYGVAAQQVPDLSGEIMDYASSKPYFQAWSEQVAKDSGGKSLGNLRAMHGKVAAGKLTDIAFDDANLKVEVCAKVVDDNEWKKVLEGVYTGFSIGGSYVGEKKVEKVDGKDLSRYTANPNELSLVDRPCIPTAKFFDVQKADGSLAKVAFQEGEPDPVDIVGTDSEVVEFGKLMNDNGLSMGDILKAMPAFIKDKVDAKKKKDGGKDDEPGAKDGAKDDAAAAEAAKKAAAPGALRKGVYDCSPFSSVLASLISLRKSAAYEAYVEGDNSPLPAKISAAISLVGECMKMLIDEVIAEDKAGTEGSPAMAQMIALAEQAGELQKLAGADDAVVALLKAGARNNAADTARLAKIHALTVELGHQCEGVDKAQAADELKKAADDLQKTVAAAVESATAPLQKALEAQAAEIKKLADQPAPARISLRAVEKSADAIRTEGEDQIQEIVAKATQPIVDDLGGKHEAAGLIKGLHKFGGTPMAMRK